MGLNKTHLMRTYDIGHDSPDPFDRNLGKIKIKLEFSPHSHASFLEAQNSWHPGSGEEKAFQFYSSCMDTRAIEAAGTGPLRQVIEEVRKAGILTFPDT